LQDDSEIDDVRRQAQNLGLASEDLDVGQLGLGRVSSGGVKGPPVLESMIDQLRLGSASTQAIRSEREAKEARAQRPPALQLPLLLVRHGFARTHARTRSRVLAAAQLRATLAAGAFGSVVHERARGSGLCTLARC
jgi:hypothetical protein